jgi:hypothetical protein
VEILILTIVGTVIGTLLAIEAKAWMPFLSRHLMRATFAHFPDGLDEPLVARWSEEIEADLHRYRDRPLGGLIFALRLRLKGGRDLAAELALQAALGSGFKETEARKAEPEPVLPKAIAKLELDFGASSAILYQILLKYLKEAASSDAETRAVGLEELRASLAHSAVRKTLKRISPPDIGDAKGLRLALMLKELREEVEEWSDQG